MWLNRQVNSGRYYLPGLDVVANSLLSVVGHVITPCHVTHM